MCYESAKTEKGNVGVSYESQEAADMQAERMDENGNTNCYNCTGCSDCTGCSRCTGCHDCSRCTGCHDCTGCTRCHGCHDCTRCHGCHYCTGCTGCHGCHYCTGCTGCHDCRYCTGCHYCTGCTGCTGCHDCTRCHDCTDTQGALRWSGEPAKNLLSINGLRWPVSTDGKSIQIGCQHHSVDEWRAFGDRVIARMDSAALEFWKAHKEMILSLAEVRKNMEEWS